MKGLRILVVRRDNIGDLLCTTPLIDTLRAHYPHAQIDALVNSYNAPILAGNPALNTIHIYTKGKHRAEGRSRFGVFFDTARLIWKMRQQRYDLIILPGQAIKNARKYAKWIMSSHSKVIGFIDPKQARQDPINVGVDPAPYRARHEAEKCQALLTTLNITDSPGPMRVFPDPAISAQARLCLSQAGIAANGRLIGLHISARRPKQRWPAENFIALAHALHALDPASGFVLFWSPGAGDNPQHPGDDEKAETIMQGCRDLPLVPLPTHRLEELIGGLSLVDSLICSDGGAMHLAAALGKPVVSLFGDSVAAHWHPWAVPHVVMQADSRDVRDISPEQLSQAHHALMSQADVAAATSVG
ncbi:glycosyltransferase family 9 protein [Paludibacterium yongneupense]|uniref:glycosyltransferase family 9 protein n=1 Tax=Paludibacterium yongneupense TaxID=400061 RepID=UPI000424D1D4|nr:glycosyltransferase family 9 protein [Paludibacterium yongneupense]